MLENLEGHILPFLENDQFVLWVVHPDEENTAYWQKWIMEHPDQLDSLLQAKELVVHLGETQKPVHAEKLSESIWENINVRTGPAQRSPVIRILAKHAHYWVAASIAGLLILISSLFYNTKIYKENERKVASYPVAAILKNNTLKRLNGTNENRVAYLVDGTKVTLQPGASISYPVFLQKDKRVVYLTGDAFFDVAKDANKPFFVYTNDIVLRVLGTSFNVSNNKNTGNITVIVKTGKVSVYNNTGLHKAEYILTPNQLITYTPQSRRIIKSDLDSAHTQLGDTPEAPAISFKFEEAPVSKIFETLEAGYGIRINFDQDAFSRCMVTTSLTDEAFEEKLKIICEAISARYRIADNQVYIDGNGCK